MAAADTSRFNMAGAGKIGNEDDVRPWVDDFQRAASEFQKSIFVNGTLTSLRQIISGMRDMPGRKSVVLLSDGFELFPRDPKRNGPPLNAVLESLKRLTDLANRSSVVIYTIDAKGLVAPGMVAAGTRALSRSTSAQRTSSSASRTAQA